VLTARVTAGVVVVLGEFVGVMVMDGLAGTVMFARVVTVTWVVTGCVPSKLTEIGLKLQVAPVGNPEQLLGLKFTTMPVEPAIAVSVTVAVADCPAGIEAGLNAPSDIWKSGAKVASQATARAFASTEPRPVTRL
jgi:hypothetical protein